MTHDGKTILVWTYEPADLFEEALNVEIATGVVHIEGGKARGEFPASEYDKAQKFRDQAHAELESHFISQQIITGKSLKLNQASLSREHPDGRRDVTAIVGTSSVVVGGLIATVDVISRNKDGNIISDTQTERLTAQKEFREKLAHCPSQNLPEIRAMAASFQKSFDDEENCFVYLYEIRDCLVSIFGNKMNATAALGEVDWREIGELSNRPTNAGGRHRGKAISHETPSPSTLRRGRDAARRLIIAYVDHINPS